MSDIFFKCHCREWRICEQLGDTKGITEQPEDTVIDHECEQIIVYRNYRSLPRHFKNKKAKSV